MISTVVVLPAPFGPSSANTSPAAIRNERSWRTGRPSYALRSPAMSTTGPATVMRPRTALTAAPSRAATAACGSRAAGDQRELALEVGVGQVPDLDRAEDAGG